ncbi:hypothetical protein EJD97_022161 [Solanum chilense]|uniref:Remorin C-terminal domain-containing protein n=1 Tax=Solanum chilense TaxID=4083 RepID=A0A6N2AWK5_SOLCI|nr:hypothetical protein EJD97_022161 [Solanum chilense]
MLNYQTPHTLANTTTTNTTTNNTNTTTENHQEEEQQQIRDIHALTPPRPPSNIGCRIETWETSSHRSPSISEVASSENFSTMSREFSALVLAGSSVSNNPASENEVNNNHIYNNNNYNSNNLGSIGEEENDAPIEETNPLAIVPDNYSNTLDPIIVNPSRRINNNILRNNIGEVSSVQRVKKEEIESKISAWQNAKISKVNNRFKREDAVINGWESEEVQKATSWMKKIERKLEEKRVKALEKMQNDIAKAHRKAEEKKASAEAKRGTKVAKVVEISNLMRAVGRAPAKRSFF